MKPKNFRNRRILRQMRALDRLASNPYSLLPARASAEYQTLLARVGNSHLRNHPGTKDIRVRMGRVAREELL
jgi:hypothetical protein